MGGQTTLERKLPATSDDESAKRRQIIDGASKVFLAQGFDAASMNDIARAAGVSKGTLYVYFDNKEELFEAIVEQECDVQAEGIFDLDPNDHDVGSSADAARRRLCEIPLPAGKGLGDPHRHRHRRPDAGNRAEILQSRSGGRHRAARRPIWPRRSMPVCWRSKIAKSRRRNSWNPATPCYSSRSCSTSRRRRASNRSNAGCGLRSRHSWPPTTCRTTITLRR